uniref:Odorant receptor n=1 Tax=Glossina brevipalpis TaxID=37001 RepID=A0A1A9WX50_9MUSC
MECRATPDTNNAFRYHWFVWQLTGIIQSPYLSVYWYRLYAVLINILVTILFPLTFVINVFWSKNLQQLCENLIITISDITANLKFLNVFLVRNELQRIKVILKYLDKRIFMEEEYQQLKRAIRIAQLSFIIFATISTTGTSLSILMVLFSQERSLLFPAWYGLDWQNNDVAYAICFTYQLVALIVQAIQNVANDSYPPTYLIILTSHMRNLELRVRSVGLSSESNTEKMFLNKREKELDLKKFNDCIEDFIQINRLYDMIQKILSKACLAQFICTALVQCVAGLHVLYLLDESNYGAQILSFIFFFAATMEVFIICYFGHYMSAQSLALVDAFYECGWISQTLAFRRNLIITLMRTQRHAIIYAGSYIPVDLPTFLLLMKYAYSTFTLLLRFK